MNLPYGPEKGLVDSMDGMGKTVASRALAAHSHHQIARRK
jgi:hypothetical protein